MGRFRTIFFTLFLLIPFPLFSQNSDDIRYIPPTNLSLELHPLATSSEILNQRFKGTIESLVGIPVNLEVFFESSKNLSVSKSSEKLLKLEPGKPVDYEFDVEQQKCKPGPDGTWIRLRVVYLPDYEAQKKVFSDAKKYPAEEERKRVLAIVETNQKQNATQTDSVRFFCNTPSKPDR
ncbi:MAG: hypothetical protein HQM08_21560 [Candidatus Riflebacteria bacterium]|nr:hypothetical protein [Candidatus Riflebacteria bacterium]